MDYCTTCRRTLNGVFVCPGCGAYAPDIAPVGSHLQLTPTTVAVMSDISHTREFDAFPGFPDAAVDADVVVDADAPVGPATRSATGRAARRRRLADWKKQRRRAVVASTVALVGGGLTLAFMPSSRPSASQAQAPTTPEPATAPSTSSAGSVDTGSEPEADPSRTHDERETGRSPKDSKDAKDSKDSNTPGSATAITPVDAPAKRKTSPQTTKPDGTRPTEDTQDTQPRSPASPEKPDSPPPTADTPTPQPNKPTEPAPAPAPPPPTAEEPADDPGLCVLVLCVDLD